MDFSEKPTAAQIENLITYLSGVWNEANLQNEVIDSYVNQTFSLWPEAQSHRPSYYTSTAARLIEQAVAAQLYYEPSIHRNPVGWGQQAEVKADAAEPWLREAFSLCGQREPELVFKSGGRYGVKYGHPMYKGPTWKDYEEEEPERKRGEHQKDFELRHAVWEGKKANWFPIQIRAVHPGSVLLDPWSKQPPVAIQLSTRYAGDLEALTRKKGQRQEGVEVYDAGENPYKVEGVADFFSDFWHVLKLRGGQILYIERNETGFTPFCHGYGGFGGLPSEEGERTNPKYLAQGILQPILHLLKLEAQGLVIRANMMDEAGFPRKGTRKDTAEAAAQLNRDGLLQGEEEDWWYLKVPQFPDYLFRAEEQNRRTIEEGTFPLSMAGYQEKRTQTLGQTEIAVEEGDKRFGSLREQNDQLASILAGHMLQLLDMMGVALRAGAYIIGPDEIQHNYNVTAKFKTVNLAQKMQMDAHALAFYQAGLRSAKTTRQATGTEDETEERERLLEQEIDKRPEVHEFMVRAAMRERRLGKLVDEMEAKEAAQQQALLGAGGGVAPGPSGLVGPSGQPLPSSMGQR